MQHMGEAQFPRTCSLQQASSSLAHGPGFQGLGASIFRFSADTLELKSRFERCLQKQKHAQGNVVRIWVASQELQ